MSYKIAVASGKGGTGKTTVAINLYHFIKNNITSNIQLVDCDVEEPNDAIFFPIRNISKTEKAFQKIPEIDTKACTFCKKCVEYCEFNAITLIPLANYAKVDKELCHSCGACMVACIHNAISEHPNLIGHINYFMNSQSKGLVEGKLKVGSAMQTLLISQVKNRAFSNNNITIYDAPPGTSCPVVETIINTDYTIIVTEPTPFGLHDLKLMVELLQELNKPMGLIINKAGLGSNEIYEYIKNKNIELLGEIPYSKTYASKYAKGLLLQDIPNNIEVCFNTITDKLKTRFTA